MITWVPYDLDQAREAMAKYSSLEQRGLWSCGFMQGATGAILMGGEPDAYLAGYAAGANARENSEEFRKEQVSEKRKAAAGKRWGKRAEDAPDDANGHANAMQTPMQNECKADANPDANGHANAMQNDAYRTGQDITKQGHKTDLCLNAARENFSPSEAQGPVRSGKNGKPSKAEFLAYAADRWPEWHASKVGAIFDEWSEGGWRTPDGAAIKSWTVLLTRFRKLTDPAHIGERVPLGSITRSSIPGLADSMRFVP